MEIESSPISETKHLMCVPGQRLCLCEENTIPGQGTYERQGYIYSMLAGLVQIRQKDKVILNDVRLSQSLQYANDIKLKSFYR